jgi:GNAT superfamily N-acetyltransferase
MREEVSLEGSDSDAIVVSRIVALPHHFDQLLSEAAAEGFGNMAVLRDEWLDGSNRFDRPGEILALASIDGEMAGIGGITQDFIDASWPRMRRFYVRPAFRRRGVGRAIARYVIEHALPFNRNIAVHAGGPMAEAFWPTLGFSPIAREKTTHEFSRGAYG